MDELTQDFEKSLFRESTDVIGDYIELGIDSFINDGVLKDVPIVNTIVAVLKVGKNIHDRNLLKQTLTFINEFNSNNISEEKIKEYKEQIEKNHKKCEEELGRILLLLNKFIDKEKSLILAKLFKAYILKIIDWNEFCEFSEIINRLFIQDLKLLEMIYKRIVIDTSNRNDMFRVERLNSLGLIGLSMKSIMVYGQNESRQDSYLTISNIGKKFMDVIMR